MFDNSDITYTMNCSPEEDGKSEKKHFSVTIKIYHHYCQLSAVGDTIVSLFLLIQ